MLLAGAGDFYLFYLFLVAPGRAWDKLSSAIRESPLYYRLTSTGVELKSESFQGRWDWNLFSPYTQETDSLAIYPKSQGNYILLPKRSFASFENINALRQLLKSHLRLW